ncbi:MAG: hypothetical protein ISR86_09970 [Nitrospinaceae bacterium]|nr:hypothetical protein [Nitrospinaceae bacterium]
MMPLDVVQRPEEEPPVNHRWCADENAVGCTGELTVPVHRWAIKMLGNMDCGAKNI